ncbi:hypothetical protein CCACVL1_28864 [Corchorus capsularis]|uniref:Uncharacterized protein n=1 Tax=Corchorus capsularis TaxID=210143 RepID=A0A1R3G4Y3_COCAP|nr:hypothetical protein CCACVL1_28864 [Corchorus capsularis]
MALAEVSRPECFGPRIKPIFKYLTQ